MGTKKKSERVGKIQREKVRRKNESPGMLLVHSYFIVTY